MSSKLINTLFYKNVNKSSTSFCILLRFSKNNLSILNRYIIFKEIKKIIFIVPLIIVYHL